MANVNFTEDSTKSSSRASSWFGYFSKEDKILRKLQSFLDDTLIPFLTEANRVVPSLFFLNTLVILFFYMQVIFGYFYLLLPKNPASEKLNFVSKIFFLFSYDYNEGGEQSYFIIIDAVFLILTGIILIDFSVNRKYRKVFLYLVRIFLGHLVNIIFVPNIVNTAYSFNIYSHNPTIGNAFISIINSILLFLVFFLGYFFSFVLHQNPFLSQQIFHWWRPERMFTFILISGFLFSLSTLSNFFTNWARLIPQCLGIILNIYFAFQINDFIYESVIVSSFHNSIPFFAFSTSILSIIFNCTNLNYNLIYFLVPLSILIISCIILVIYYKQKAKKITAILNTQEFVGAPLNDESKLNFYDSLNLSLSNSFFYLQVGLKFNCPLFLDWSLSNFLFEKFKESRELLTFITWQTAFFPSAAAQFSHFVNSGIKMINQPYYIRAFFYQLHRVHIFRQGATSQESAADLITIQKKTRGSISLISEFWHSVAENKNRPSLVTIHKISKKINETEAIWSEMLDKYPNNSLFVRDYSVFLLDAKSCFHDSILWHQRSIMLENGHKLQNDQMFRCFLKMYPHYLKKEIVDTRGNLKKTKTKQKVTFSDINGNQSSPENSSDTIDDVEGATFLPLLQLRLALERAIKSVTSPILNKAIISILIRLIICIVFITILNSHISTIFRPREIISIFLHRFQLFSHPLEVMSHETAWLYITSFPEVSNGSSMFDIYSRIFGQQAHNIKYYVDVKKPLEEIVYNLSQISLENVNLFSRFLYLNIEEGKSILKDFSSFFSKEKINSVRCYQKANKEFDFFNYQVSFDFFIRSFLTGEMKMTSHNSTVRRTWGNNDQYCSTAYQTISLYNALDSLISFLIEPLSNDFGISFARTFDELYIQYISKFFISFVPFVILAILFPNVAFLTSGLDTERMQFIDLLLSVNKKDAEEASNELYRMQRITGPPSSTTLISRTVKKSRKFSSIDYRQSMIYLNIFGDIALYLLLCIFIIVMLIITMKTDTRLSNTNEHFELTLLQRNILIDMARDAACLVFVNQMEKEGFTINLTSKEKLNNLSFLSTSSLHNVLENDIKRYQNVEKLIKGGIGIYEPVIGYDKQIDYLFHQNKCTPELSQPAINYSNCISLDRLISYFSSQVNYILHLYANRRVLDESVVELAYLVESRIANDYDELLELYYQISQNILHEYNTYFLIFFIIQIALSIIISLTELVIIVNLKKEYVVYKSLLLRVNPLSFVSNQTLLDWIFKSTSFKSTNKVTTPAHVIFQTSHDSMILISLNKVIEFLNPATSVIFGFTPEQMLGQNLKIILPKENNRQLYYIMSLMKCGQASLTFESAGQGIRDNGQSVPLHLLLIGYNTQNDGKKADYFALILKDKSEEVSQKSAIENSKKQADMILQQLLPREIILQLGQKDNDISFTANLATICFVDIDKFSIYSSSLPPTDVLRNLSKIFSTFDMACTKYSLMTKIKLIGDVYMAAAGLFSPNIPPEKHANQIIQFGLEVLNAMEALNIQMDANLQIRIGVNTDGPLIVGVIGHEKPLFEVIGEPLIDAEAIEKAGVPGCVTISERTYKHIAENSKYRIEPHIEVGLKRNGKCLSYLISPDETDASKYGNISISDDEINNSSITFSRILTCSSSIDVHLNQTKTKQINNIISQKSISTLHGIKPATNEE